MTNRVPLVGLSRELTARTGRPAPGYRKLWLMIANGELPADQLANGRYVVDPDVIAEKLGMTAPSRAA